MLAVGEHMLGKLEPQAVRMTTGLAGGVGSGHQEMCGALSGGVLVIGGLFGRENLAQDDERALSLVRRYRDDFLTVFGETQCEKLRERIHVPGGLGSCAVLAERAAALLLVLLGEAGDRK